MLIERERLASLGQMVGGIAHSLKTPIFSISGGLEGISDLIKEMSVLFKQLQESEIQLNSTTSEIEEMVKNMRVLPLSTIFQLFPRMVHNIARDKNKKIEKSEYDFSIFSLVLYVRNFLKG